ncbi:MAG: hypothetical protein IJ156_09660 [Bacteroidales bacterium]|nr:hypothetical protein [Bacteroidales bacterium]
MKRLITVMALLLTVSAGLFAQQGKVTTRKHLFADFTDKITKVVMTGGDVLDGALRQEVVDLWTASPFEFCTAAEYNALKGSDAYYFLLVTEGRAKGEEEPMVRFLTLEKGGAESGDNIPLRTEVVSLPLCPAEGSLGREVVFLPAYVNSIQQFALNAMESERTAYSGMNWFNENYDRKGGIKRIYLANEDLSSSVTDKDKAKYIDEDIILCDEDEADKVYTDKTYNTLVSYTVSAGTWCYKLLLEADTDTVYYVRKHKVTGRNAAGFLAEDLRRMSRKR